MTLAALRRKFLLDLPMRIGDHRPSTGDGTEKLTDWNMEASGVGAWTASNATLTKVPGTAPMDEGTQLIRIAQTTALTSAIAFQPASVTIGEEYRVRGLVRSGGVLVPALRDAGVAYVWQGVASSDFQQFDFVYTAGAAALELRSVNGAGAIGDYIEFAFVSVQKTSPRTLNRGSLSNELDAFFGDGAAPTKLNFRRGYDYNGSQYAWLLQSAAQPNILSDLNLPLTVGFVGSCSVDFSGDGGGWRAVETVLELRNETAAADRKVPFNIGFDQNTISLGRGATKYLATLSPLQINKQYVVIGSFDETNYYIFIDGILRGTGAHAGGDESTGSKPSIVSNCTLAARTTDLGVAANMLNGETHHAFISDQVFSELDAKEYHYWMSRLCGRAREAA